MSPVSSRHIHDFIQSTTSPVSSRHIHDLLLQIATSVMHDHTLWTATHCILTSKRPTLADQTLSTFEMVHVYVVVVRGGCTWWCVSDHHLHTTTYTCTFSLPCVPLYYLFTTHSVLFLQACRIVPTVVIVRE